MIAQTQYICLNTTFDAMEFRPLEHFQESVVSDAPKVVWCSGSALPSWLAGLGSSPGAEILLFENQIFRPTDLGFGWGRDAQLKIKLPWPLSAIAKLLHISRQSCVGFLARYFHTGDAALFTLVTLTCLILIYESNLDAGFTVWCLTSSVSECVVSAQQCRTKPVPAAIPRLQLAHCYSCEMFGFWTLVARGIHYRARIDSTAFLASRPIAIKTRWMHTPQPLWVCE